MAQLAIFLSQGSPVDGFPLFPVSSFTCECLAGSGECFLESFYLPYPSFVDAGILLFTCPGRLDIRIQKNQNEILFPSILFCGNQLRLNCRNNPLFKGKTKGDLGKIQKRTVETTGRSSLKRISYLYSVLDIKSYDRF
jgi:hypothetical protein